MSPPPTPPQSPGRPSKSYSQAERVIHMLVHLMAGGQIAPSSYGQRCGVSRRTVERDIAVLRNALDDDLEHIEQETCWVYRLKRAARSWKVDRAEVLALLAGAQTTNFLSGPHFHTDIDAIIEQLTRSLRPGDQLKTRRVRRKMWVTQTGDKNYAEQPDAQQNLGALVDGLMYEKPVALTYLSHRRHHDGSPPLNLTVHPLSMVLHRGGVYFLVLDAPDAPSRPTARQPWLIALDRIERAEFLVDAPQFAYPKDFHPADYFADSFGIFTGDDIHDVELLISPFMAPYVLERRWHASEQFEKLEDGRLRVKLRVRGLLDVQDWVLRMGEHVEVVRPDELRRRVVQSLRGALAMYERDA